MDTALAGTAVTVALALVAVIYRMGRLEQRLETAESKNAEQDRRIDEGIRTASGHDTKLALGAQHVGNVEQAVQGVRQDIGQLHGEVSAVKQAQIAHQGDLRLVVDGLQRLEETVIRSDEATHSMLSSTQNMLTAALEVLKARPPSPP